MNIKPLKKIMADNSPKLRHGKKLLNRWHFFPCFLFLFFSSLILFATKNTLAITKIIKAAIVFGNGGFVLQFYCLCSIFFSAWFSTPYFSPEEEVMEAEAALEDSRVVAAENLAAVVLRAPGSSMINMKRSNDPILFFSKAEKALILKAIDNVEMQTSAEIRVHLERKADQDILKHGSQIFEKIGMTKTDQRNGVLIFIGVASHLFAILGDVEINKKVDENFWNEIAKILQNKFKQNLFAEGLEEGIAKIGDKLKEIFPGERDDVNELSDEISYSK